MPKSKNMLSKARLYLQGKKTYLQGLAAALVVLALHLGWMDQSTAATLLGLLGAGSILSLGAKVDRAAK